MDEQVETFERRASAAFAPMRVRPIAPGTFTSALRATSAGDVVISRITGTPCHVRRDPRLISSTDPALVKVALHAYGRAGVEQHGRQCLLTPGDLVNYVTDQPYDLHFWEPYETVVIGVPRKLVGAHADSLARRAAIAVSTDTGVRRAVGGFFRTLTDTLEPDGFTGSAVAHLADAVVSMVISELVDVPVRHDDDLADRLLAYCLARLPDPALSVESVARAHGISTRHLHKIFEAREETLSSWIRRQRLTRIKRDLTDPALADRTAAAIAARWGLLSPAHLSRALKAEFGRTAAEIRSEAHRG